MNPSISPEVADFFPQVKVGKVDGAFAIAAHPFARRIGNEDLLALALQAGLPATNAENARSAISGTGFKARHLNHLPGHELNPEEALNRQAIIGAHLLRRTMEEMRWDEIDAYIDTSAFLPPTVNEQILDEAGLLGKRVRSISYRYACAGALTALVDTLSSSEYEGRQARIVIGANEPLSWLMHQKHLSTLENLHIPALFSDGNAALAFDSSKFELQKKRVLVKPDGGVIRLTPDYASGDVIHDPTILPSYYHSAETNSQLLHFSNRTRVLEYQGPNDKDLQVSIDGMGTLRFFGSTTASEILALREQVPNVPIDGSLNIILHPASEPVLKLISRKLQNSGATEIGELPFRMAEADLANSSSATILNYWLHMILNNQYYPHLPHLWIAPGIGSVTTTAIGNIKN